MNTLLLVSIGLGVLGQNDLPDWPPLPENGEHVDYIKWYDDARRAGMKPEDDAFPLYRKIMPSIDDPDGKRPEKFRFSGFRHEEEMPKGYPRPWDPKEHPEWEASYQRTKAALKQFKKAAAKPYYFVPNRFDAEADSTGPLLYFLRIGSLAEFRRYGKGLSEAAWRKVDGRVDAGAFTKNVRGLFQAAEQLQREPLVLAQLVAASLRTMAYEDIRRAIQFEVFSKSDLEFLQTAIDEVDGSIPPISFAMRGECAIGLDMVQFINKAKPSQLFGDFKGISDIVRNRGTTMLALARDVLRYMKAAARVADATNHGERPDSKAISTMEKIEKENPAAKVWMPDLKHANSIIRRTESSRCATRLVIAIYLHKLNNDEWPKSLDELPMSVAKKFGNEPVSNQPFVYVLKNGKPKLYSKGFDAKDDHGKHDPGFGENEPNSDFVFWPPQDDRMPDKRKPKTADKPKK